MDREINPMERKVGRHAFASDGSRLSRDLPEALRGTLAGKDLLLAFHAVPRLDFRLVPPATDADIALELANADTGAFYFLCHAFTPGRGASPCRARGTNVRGRRHSRWPDGDRRRSRTVR